MVWFGFHMKTNKISTDDHLDSLKPGFFQQGGGGVDPCSIKIKDGVL